MRPVVLQIAKMTQLYFVQYQGHVRVMYFAYAHQPFYNWPQVSFYHQKLHNS